MSGTEAAQPSPRTGAAELRDYIALSKPSITRMCLIMTAGGMWLAPRSIDRLSAVSVMLGTALTVTCANALNMWWERETDKLMSRTKNRPLPTGRMSERQAVTFGLISGILGCALLAYGTNLLTAGLGLFAILSYVGVYTPLKTRTAWSVFIGTIPGAMPPLMGWTAATGRLDTPGLVLFTILLVWQIPHFLAISIFRQSEYDRAGIIVVPSAWGLAQTKFQIVFWSVVLVPVGMLLTPIDVTGSLYAVVAGLAGLGFLGFGVVGYWTEDLERWGRRLFFASLAYLPIITIALVADKILG